MSRLPAALAFCSLVALGSAASAPKSPARQPSPAPTRKPTVPAAPKAGTQVKPAASSKPAPAPETAPATPAPAVPAAYTTEGPLDLFQLRRQGQAVLTSARLAAGDLETLQDGNRYTGVEFAEAPGPAWLQVVLDRAAVVLQADVIPGEGGQEWVLDAADTVADLQGKKGSYRRLGGPRRTVADELTQVVPDAPRAYRVYRLELRATVPGARPRLGEWALWTKQRLSRMQIDVLDTTMAVGGVLPLRANGTFEAGARQNMTPDVQWLVEPPSRGTVDAFTRFCAAQAGRVRLTALQGTLRSEPLELEVLPQGKPDWDVTYLERQPRFPMDGKTRLIPGQTVQWFAHIKNYGTADAAPVTGEWRIDGEKVQTVQFGKLERFLTTESILTTKWDGKRHRIELMIDPGNAVAETCEGNNTLAVDSDAQAVGFWVEDGLIRYFHRYQRELNAGGNSWEDWAQRQVSGWNRWLDRTTWLWTTPDQQIERWRLDRIIQVGDGMLPMAGGNAWEHPDRRDQTVSLSCGFPSSDLRGPRYRTTTKAEPGNPFYYDPALVRALARTRFVR